MSLCPMFAVALRFAFKGLVRLIQNLKRSDREDFYDIVQGPMRTGKSRRAGSSSIQHAGADLLDGDKLMDDIFVDCFFINLLSMEKHFVYFKSISAEKMTTERRRKGR